MRSGFDNEKEAVGSEEESQKEEVRPEVLTGQKESRLSEEL